MKESGTSLSSLCPSDACAGVACTIAVEGNAEGAAVVGRMENPGGPGRRGLAEYRRFFLSCSFLSAMFILSACTVARQREMKGDLVVSRSAGVTRAAFEIGATSTKLRVAKVTLYPEGGLEVGEELTGGSRFEKVDYVSDVRIRPSRDFSAETMQRGIDAVARLRKYAAGLGADQFSAVATGVFREAHNGATLAEEIFRKTGIPVYILDDAEAARLGFLAVQHQWKFVPERLVLWDIGSESSCLVFPAGGNGLDTCMSRLGSVSTKEILLSEVKGIHDPSASPNPVSAEEAEALVRILKRRIAETVTEKLARLLQSRPDVVGIGPVHNKCVRRACGIGYTYEVGDVEKALKRSLGKGDDVLGGPCPDTLVPNLALVLAFLQVLGVDEVKTVDANLADGLLHAPKYWKNIDSQKARVMKTAN